MSLRSTRGEAAPVSAPQAILRGLAPDGGLFVPEAFPGLSLEEIEKGQWDPYTAWAGRVLGALLPGFETQALEQAIGDAYARFDHPEVAPLLPLDDHTAVLELFHGPTLAFKDVALQLLPRLSAQAKALTGETRELFVLVATSGDTGKAALEGFMDVPGTRCAVFFPKEGVSAAQRLQMLTQAGDNTHVIAVRGNFDDAQTGVKALFQDAAFAAELDGQGRVLSSANSINYGRLVPQVVYYFYAYARMLRLGRLRPGEPLHFAVPTGNFGNILAAYYAARMGLPVGKLLCASNANHVLADFLQSGVYDAQRSFHTTLSPSMDILISSNLERLLFELADREAPLVAGWMSDLRQKSRYDIGKARLARMSECFIGGWADDARTSDQIRRTLRGQDYLLDPHTAVAAAVLEEYREGSGDATPCVLVATASPYKFGRDVLYALEDIPADLDDFEACRRLAGRTGGRVPPQIANLPALPILHREQCDPDTMEPALRDILRNVK